MKKPLLVSIIIVAVVIAGYFFFYKTSVSQCDCNVQSFLDNNYEACVELSTGMSESENSKRYTECQYDYSLVYDESKGYTKPDAIMRRDGNNPTDMIYWQPVYMKDNGIYVNEEHKNQIIETLENQMTSEAEQLNTSDIQLASNDKVDASTQNEPDLCDCLVKSSYNKQKQECDILMENYYKTLSPKDFLRLNMQQVFDDFRFEKEEEKGYIVRDEIMLAYQATDGTVKMQPKVIYFHKSPTKKVHSYEVASIIK